MPAVKQHELALQISRRSPKLYFKLSTAFSAPQSSPSETIVDGRGQRLSSNLTSHQPIRVVMVRNFDHKPWAVSACFDRQLALSAEPWMDRRRSSLFQYLFAIRQ